MIVLVIRIVVGLAAHSGRDGHEVTVINLAVGEHALDPKSTNRARSREMRR